MCNYIPTKSEWNKYNNFKPSLLQKIVNLFWPLEVIIKWRYYQEIDIKDCCE